MPKKIVQQEDLILRKTAKEVPVSKIKSPEIQKILKEMKEALASQEDGVALAAPQIGYSLRIFIVSEKVEKMLKKKKKEGVPEKKTEFKDTIYINPSIKKISRERKVLEEGCLSVRYLYGQVERGSKAIIEAYNEKGEKFSRGGSGLLAQIFQHEVDHLNGVLFIDKAEYIEEILPEDLKAKSKK